MLLKNALYHNTKQRNDDMLMHKKINTKVYLTQ